MKNKKISKIILSTLLISTVSLSTVSAYNPNPTGAAWSPWMIESKQNAGTEYGAWSIGAQAKGSPGGKLSFKKSVKVSNTLSGSLKVSRSDVEASLGFTTNKTTKKTASYSMNATDRKKTYTIKYRNIYKKIKINQIRRWQVNGRVKDTQKATAYAKQFTGFGYDWTAK